MHIPTGSASYGVPQDGQDENFMTAQDDCSLSACVAFAVAVAHLLILFALRLCIVCAVSFVFLFRAFVIGLYEMERQRQGWGLQSAAGGWLSREK